MKRIMFALLAVTALAATSGCCCLERWWCRPWGCNSGCNGGLGIIRCCHQRDNGLPGGSTVADLRGQGGKIVQRLGLGPGCESCSCGKSIGVTRLVSREVFRLFAQLAAAHRFRSQRGDGFGGNRHRQGIGWRARPFGRIARSW